MPSESATLAEGACVIVGHQGSVGGSARGPFRLACAHRTYSHNKGRLAVESHFGALVNGETYLESVLEGEFEMAQSDRGSTIASGTLVPATVGAEGRVNYYYQGFEEIKTYCDEDYDLVFSTSFGFMSQTLDVSGSYAPCTVAADGATPHTTHFVHASAGYKTNDRMSTMFGAGRERGEEVEGERYQSDIFPHACRARSPCMAPNHFMPHAVILAGRTAAARVFA